MQRRGPPHWQRSGLQHTFNHRKDAPEDGNFPTRRGGRDDLESSIAFTATARPPRFHYSAGRLALLCSHLKRNSPTIATHRSDIVNNTLRSGRACLIGTLCVGIQCSDNQHGRIWYDTFGANAAIPIAGAAKRFPRIHQRSCLQQSSSQQQS